MNNEITIDGVVYVRKPQNLLTNSTDLFSASWIKAKEPIEYFKELFMPCIPWTIVYLPDQKYKVQMESKSKIIQFTMTDLKLLN